MNVLPWKRRHKSRAAEALAAEIKRIVMTNNHTPNAAGLIAKAIAGVDESDCREALQVLLADPEALFPDNYWYRPTSGILRLTSIQKAVADPLTARLAAEALIQLRRKRPAWAFDQAEVLGAMLVMAIANVSVSDLPATVKALLTLVEYVNTIKDQRFGGIVLPPPPPPRFMLEAIGALQSRDPGLAWQVIREMSQGPTSLAKVLGRLGSFQSGTTSIQGNADVVLKLVDLATDLKSIPTKAWLQRWEKVRGSAGPGMREALLELTLGGEVLPDLTYGGSGTDIPRAAMIALASWKDPETRAFFRKAILNWARSGVGSPVIGTAAVWSLASCGDRQAVATMLDIRRRIHHKNLLKRLDQEIDRLSQQLGVSADEIADESIDDCGLDGAGARSWKIGDYLVTLKLAPAGDISRDVAHAAGKAVKELPSGVRKEHAETWAEVAAATKLLKETVSAQRQRLELAMVDGREWGRQRWDAIFRGHPILWNLSSRLVWEVQSSTRVFVMPTPTGWSGEALDEIPQDARLRLAHPVTMAAPEQAYWQHRIVAAALVQPFKQVFRETYFVTPAELLERDRSHRFSGHVIPNQTMYALAKGRGWSGTMGLSGFDGSGLGSREFPSWGVRASIEQDWTGNDTFSTIAEVSFMRRDENREWRRAEIGEIPPIPFSEAMRDLDLVVAVASIGTDQQWLEWEGQREAGTVNWTDQRREYASLAAAGSAVRGQMLREMLPRLGLADRASVEDHFVHVRGKLGEYRIHLGSGNIHMEPSGRYLCIVPAPVKEDRMIYLPFEDPDLKSAEVLSKVILLVSDDKITDPVITAQLKLRD